MLGRTTASLKFPMGEMSDRHFLFPRQLFAKDRINIYDAISLVVYAKLPMKGVLSGKALVAGFFERDGTGATSALVGKQQSEEILARYAKTLSPLRYPVPPSQYESLLEAMLEAGENIFPFFIHEHHLLLDRRTRAAMFLQFHRELMEDARKGALILQISDAKRTTLLTAEAWMTQSTLKTFLDNHGVTPWWKNDGNLATHSRLEPILPSDSLDLPSNYAQEAYDVQQLPSFVFGRMLLKSSYLPPGYKRPSRAAQASLESTEKTADSRASLPERLKEPRKAPQSPTTPSLPAPVVDKTPAEPTLASRPSTADSPPDGLDQKNTRDPAAPDENMLDKRGVAKLLDVSVGTVDNYRKRPDFPKEVTYGPTTIRWKRREVIEWRDQPDSRKSR